MLHTPRRIACGCVAEERGDADRPRVAPVRNSVAIAGAPDVCTGGLEAITRRSTGARRVTPTQVYAVAEVVGEGKRAERGRWPGSPSRGVTTSKAAALLRDRRAHRVERVYRAPPPVRQHLGPSAVGQESADLIFEHRGREEAALSSPDGRIVAGGGVDVSAHAYPHHAWSDRDLPTCQRRRREGPPAAHGTHVA